MIVCSTFNDDDFWDVHRGKAGWVYLGQTQTVLVRVAFSRRWNLCHHLIFFASRGLIELYMGRGCLWDSAKQYPAAGQRYLVVLMHEVDDFILTL
jgi:hypothetical protein